MSTRHLKLIADPRRRRAVLAVAFLLLGFQVVGASLHATTHDAAGDCQICLTYDRLDTAVMPVVESTAGPAADVLRAQLDYPLFARAVLRAYAIRAPPAARRF